MIGTLKSLARCAAFGAAAALSPLEAAERELLPTTTAPLHYRVEVTPDVAALTFAGKAEIDLEVREATDRIVLNSKDIAIDSAALADHAEAPKVEYDEAHDRVSFVFPAALAPGKYHLAIAYRGKIYETSSGLFITPYTDNGVKKVILATQFEPGDARRLAPMWDEPAIKTVFEVAMVVPADQTAVSNTQAVSSETLVGKTRVSFAPTPKMSSYLLFLGMGELERITDTSGPTEIGVITRRGDGVRGKYALDISRPILDYYNDYFGQTYPLAKLDHFAVPGAGGFGAMENWGAIFYFETALLVDPALTTEADRQRIYGTIAHEMAHQWFGDLVTMAWWDDLWLNEGFASWMQKKAADKFNPDWGVWLQAVKTQQSAMKLDARASTHPVVQPVANVEEAETAFDDITYDKGQSVITMLEAYLGEDAFRAGVRRYMAKHAYGNTVTEDLWTELQAASDAPVVAIARDFTRQPGVPLIVVDSVACRDGQTFVAVHQDRFGVDESAAEKLSWHVPVVVQTLGASEAGRAVVEGKAEIAAPGCGTVKVNAGSAGYFRTLYPAEAFAALKADFTKLATLDQLGLLFDTWALAAAGMQPVADYLSLSGDVADNADPVVWLQVTNTYSDIADLYRGETGAETFAAYARGRLKPQLTRIGWDAGKDEPPNVGILRDALIETLAKLGDPDVRAEASRRFAAFEADPKSLPGGIRRGVTRAVAMQADAAMWDKLHAFANAAPSPLEQRFYLDALTFVLDPALAAKTLALTIGDEVPKQYAPRMIQSVAQRHPDLAWAFVRDNMDAIDGRMDEMARYSFIPRIAAYSANPGRADELEELFKQRLPDGPQAEMNRAMGKIRTESDVRVKRLPEINDWLSRIQ
ncbi:Aminopeptidase N [Alphaproteobacteria bacterium SO-S41]|nr:Aminopeptidase N [Alphaproteobacteria bacterium SO-S41]